MTAVVGFRNRGVPIFLLEEHHEAFIAWHQSIEKGLLPASGNTLLHVDEHSDLSLPRLRRPLASLADPAEDIGSFAYQELDIGNFIWPAIYLGFFREIYWLRHRHTAPCVRNPLFIRAANEGRTEFVTGIEHEPCTAEDARHVEIEFTDGACEVHPTTPLVLDIDLDYFSSHHYPDYAGRRLEITRAAFEEFTGDRYHFLRIAPGGRPRALTEGGRYYLVFNDFSPSGGFWQPPSRAEITERLDTFYGFLERNRLQPLLIDVSRSVLSGYTPRSDAEFIEQGLLERLKSLYPLRAEELLQPQAADRVAKEDVHVH